MQDCSSAHGAKAALVVICALAITVLGCKEPSSGPATTESASPAPISERWIEPQMGRRFTSAYVQRKDCKGHFDVVTRRYSGDPPGFEVEGWAWDVTAKKSADRIIFVDTRDIIVGGGHGGSERPDVPDVVKEVTTKTSGWYGVVRAQGGLIEAYAILDGGDACPIGSMKL